jgi:hypothetical protein
MRLNGPYLLTFCFIYVYTEFLVFARLLIITIQGFWIFISDAFVDIFGQIIFAVAEFDIFGLNIRWNSLEPFSRQTAKKFHHGQVQLRETALPPRYPLLLVVDAQCVSVVFSLPRPSVQTWPPAFDKRL